MYEVLKNILQQQKEQSNPLTDFGRIIQNKKLANQLEWYISKSIHCDPLGFIPKKDKSFNMSKLNVNLTDSRVTS